MLKKIKINLGYHGWTTRWAWVDSVFAIHKSVEDNSFHLWALTHIPTGMKLGINDVNSRGEILQRLEKYKSFEWRGIKPLEDLKVCDLINLAPMIQKQTNSGINMDDWEKSYQLPAAHALGCEIES